MRGFFCAVSLEKTGLELPAGVCMMERHGSGRGLGSAVGGQNIGKRCA